MTRDTDTRIIERDDFPIQMPKAFSYVVKPTILKTTLITFQTRVRATIRSSIVEGCTGVSGLVRVATVSYTENLEYNKTNQSSSTLDHVSVSRSVQQMVEYHTRFVTVNAKLQMRIIEKVRLIR
jgi:predicted histidine transporter YuiF (NhaC family)